MIEIREMRLGYRVLLGVLAALGCGDEESAPPMTDAWNTLPGLDGTVHKQWSSFERGSSGIALFAHSNKDFNNFIQACGTVPLLQYQETDRTGPCVDPARGYLIAEDLGGPGVVSRMYFTAGPLAPPSTATFRDEIVRIIADDRVLYEGMLASWRTGDAFMRKPLARYTSGALVSYEPIVYQKSLQVMLDRLNPDTMYYYQIDARTQLARPPESREALAFLADNPGQLPGGALQRVRHVDREFPLSPGQGVDVLQLEGAGTLQLLSFGWFSGDESAGKDTRLQLHWDGEQQPSLDVPLATLFGGLQKLRAFRTLPMAVELAGGRTIVTSTLPLPFGSGARVRLFNAGSVPHAIGARVEGTPQLPAGEFGELRATWMEASGPFTPADRVRATSFAGRGKFVGLMLFVEGRGKADGQTPHPISFLEGDTTFIVDGQSFQGTGTEDYFNAGFYFQDGPYEAPFSALVHLVSDLERGRSEVTAVRWHVLEDAIEFQQGFELRFEPGSYEPLAAQRYAALAFYYAP